MKIGLPKALLYYYYAPLWKAFFNELNINNKVEEKMIIVCILLFLISLFMYLIIVGGNLNKSDYEKMLEDEEQLKYIKSYKNKVEDKN